MSKPWDERIVGGQYQIRETPVSLWRIVYNDVADVANLMVALSNEERLQVMGLFCPGCGIVQGDSPCQCQNDE